MDYKQSTCHVLKIALLVICQSALCKNSLWNQGLLFSISVSPPYPPVEPSAPGRDPAGNNSSQPAGPPPPAGPTDPANEAGASAIEEVLLVLVAEPQAPTWARHIVHFLQTGELPAIKMKLRK